MTDAAIGDVLGHNAELGYIITKVAKIDSNLTLLSIV